MVRCDAAETALVPAIDMHVHLEPEHNNDADAAANRYFAILELFRSRKIGYIVFSVDETLTGKPRVTNNEVVRFATANADIAIPFASIDPKRGKGAEAPQLHEAVTVLYSCLDITVSNTALFKLFENAEASVVRQQAQLQFVQQMPIPVPLPSK